MKRQTLLDLIKSHFNRDEVSFNKNAKKIIREVKEVGDIELSKSISNVLKNNTIVNVSNTKDEMIMNQSQKELISILSYGIGQSMVKNIFIHGRPGTGKTLFVNTLSKTIHKEMKTIHLSEIISYKLGESMQLLENIFSKNQGKILFLDEVDSIASQRGNSTDLFEINRILNTLFKIIDSNSEDTVLICVTNLFQNIDLAFLRRFHIIANFDQYSYIENLDIWELYSKKFNVQNDTQFYKNFILLIKETYNLWTPAFIENIARIVSLWQTQDKIPFLQIREIFNQINLTKEFLKEKKTTPSLINYFFSNKEYK